MHKLVMDPRHIKFQINEIRHKMKTCNDELDLIVLQDILLKKQRDLSMLNKIHNDKEKVDNALDVLIEQKEEEEEDEAYQRILKDNKRDEQYEIKKNEHDKLWNKKADPKYERELEKDFANNKLMERMNSELDFRVHGVDKNSMSKAFKQYDDEDDGNYVSVRKFKKYSIPTDNFSSKRMLGKRKNI